MPKQFKVYGVLIGILVLSLIIGNALAEGDYITPSLLLLLALSVAAIVVPGYGFFLAFGLLCPFAFPIPYVYRFPFAGLVLGLCCVKFVVSQGLSQSPFRYRFAATVPILILFGWVIIRYCMNPVLPGLAIGTGNAVTGFRGYLNYAVCLGIVLTLPLFIKTRDDMVRLLHWLAYVSLLFAILLIPLTLTKSLKSARILTNLGMSVLFFDNGWLRFVSLSGFGLILITLALLPNVMPLRRWQQVLFITIGLIAVVFGGNRTSLGMAIIILLCISAARRRARLVAATITGIVGTLVAFYFIGENMTFRRGVGFYRVMALVSPRTAERSEAAATFLWRKLRWERAVMDIQKAPWIGMGYGGLGAIFTYVSSEDFEENAVEIDVAAGSVHNGFLASARAFGIPFTVLFLLVMLHRIIRHGREAIRLHRPSPLQSELHAFFFATLSAMIMAIYLGIDLNFFQLWFYIGLGVILRKLQQDFPVENRQRERNQLQTTNTGAPLSPKPSLRSFSRSRI